MKKERKKENKKRKNCQIKIWGFPINLWKVNNGMTYDDEK